MATINLSENNQQQQIEVTVNDTILLQLQESPTTGYRWEITELNPNHLQVVSEEFKTDSSSGIGGGGKKIIQLKVLAKESGRLILENRQPWSKAVDKTIEVSYH